MNTSQSPDKKIARLKQHLAQYEKLAVAYSAGVDSTFLLAVAHEVLGDAVCALTAQSPTFPPREMDEARTFCEEHGIAHIVFESHEFDIPGFDHNPENRCYLCKTELFSNIVRIAEEQNLGPVADGSNTDDLGDYRPGRKALGELGIISPLLECGFSKADIRACSAHMGLPTANKQSFACLASRFAYGDLISEERLNMVDAAEQALLARGLSTVRVRVNGEEARIEVLPEDFMCVLAAREAIVEDIKAAGFSYVALDLLGYRTGAMNETLPKEQN